MMLSVGKIFWLLIILVSVWYIFKIIEKRKLNFRNNNKNKSDANKKGIDTISLSLSDTDNLAVAVAQAIIS